MATSDSIVAIAKVMAPPGSAPERTHPGIQPQNSMEDKKKNLSLKVSVQQLKSLNTTTSKASLLVNNKALAGRLNKKKEENKLLRSKARQMEQDILKYRMYITYLVKQQKQMKDVLSNIVDNILPTVRQTITSSLDDELKKLKTSVDSFNGNMEQVENLENLSLVANSSLATLNPNVHETTKTKRLPCKSRKKAVNMVRPMMKCGSVLLGRPVVSLRRVLRQPSVQAQPLPTMQENPEREEEEEAANQSYDSNDSDQESSDSSSDSQTEHLSTTTIVRKTVAQRNSATVARRNPQANAEEQTQSQRQATPRANRQSSTAEPTPKRATTSQTRSAGPRRPATSRNSSSPRQTASSNRRQTYVVSQHFVLTPCSVKLQDCRSNSKTPSPQATAAAAVAAAVRVSPSLIATPTQPVVVLDRITTRKRPLSTETENNKPTSRFKMSTRDGKASQSTTHEVPEVAVKSEPTSSESSGEDSANTSVIDLLSITPQNTHAAVTAQVDETVIHRSPEKQRTRESMDVMTPRSLHNATIEDMDLDDENPTETPMETDVDEEKAVNSSRVTNEERSMPPRETQSLSRKKLSLFDLEEEEPVPSEPMEMSTFSLPEFPPTQPTDESITKRIPVRVYSGRNKIASAGKKPQSEMGPGTQKTTAVGSSKASQLSPVTELQDSKETKSGGEAGKAAIQGSVNTQVNVASQMANLISKKNKPMPLSLKNKLPPVAELQDSEETSNPKTQSDTETGKTGMRVQETVDMEAKTAPQVPLASLLAKKSKLVPLISKSKLLSVAELQDSEETSNPETQSGTETDKTHVQETVNMQVKTAPQVPLASLLAKKNKLPPLSLKNKLPPITEPQDPEKTSNPKTQSGTETGKTGTRVQETVVMQAKAAPQVPLASLLAKKNKPMPLSLKIKLKEAMKTVMGKDVSYTDRAKSDNLEVSEAAATVGDTSDKEESEDGQPRTSKSDPWDSSDSLSSSGDSCRSPEERRVYMQDFMDRLRGEDPLEGTSRKYEPKKKREPKMKGTVTPAKKSLRLHNKKNYQESPTSPVFQKPKEDPDESWRPAPKRAHKKDKK